MKKLLIKAIKYIHHFTNNTVSDKDEADTLYNCMAYKNNPLLTLRVFEELEKRVESEMKLEEKRCAEFCRAVNAKWKPEPVKMSYLELLVKDPVFESPIKDKVA